MLALTATVVSVVWGLALPPLQGPDETGHVAYVQRIAETGRIPFAPRRPGGGRGIDTASTELRAAARDAGLEALRGNPAARPFWSGPDVALLRADLARLGPGAASDGHFNSAFRNPPLYYLYAVPLYAAAGGGSVLARTWAMRLGDVPLAIVLVALTWLLASELLGAGTGGAALASALVALHPGIANLEGIVSPDLLLVVLWTAALLVMMRLMRRGARPRDVLAVVALLLAAAATNGRGMFLLVPAVVALLIVWRRGARRAAPRRWWAAAAGLLVAGLAVGAVVVTRPVTNGFAFGQPTIPGFLSYLWQFYLPRLPGMGRAPGPPGYGVREAFVGRVWGGLAQLEVELPGWVVDALLGASLLLLALTVATVLRRRLDRGVVAVALAAVAGLLLPLHVAAYRSLVIDPSDPVITGRYLLVLAPLAAVATAGAVLRGLPNRMAPIAAGLVLGSAVVLQLDGLGRLVERFWT